MFPHRSTTLVAIVIFVALSLFIFSASNIDSSSEPVGGISEGTKPKFPLPNLDTLRFRFRPAAHRPPEQKDSSSGELKWYNDWTWLNPFSSSITLEEDRSVLPPLRTRRPVYTFYESSDKSDDEEKEADRKLLLVWRRAWYAQGFRPVVLTRAEAMNNPLYEAVQQLKIDPALHADLLRWLAWENMGTGLLADWHCFPMARYDDWLLSSLRRGALPTHITRFENFDSGLFAGEKARIGEAIKEAIKAANSHASSITELIPPEFFRIEKPTSLAFYNSAAISTHYSALSDKHAGSSAARRLALVELVNAHLHNTFQHSFSSGIAILRPLPERTMALVEPALRLAKALAQCPTTQFASCPPNRPKCQPCVSSSKPMPIIQPSAFKNTTNLFTIGIVPHPYTLISLQSGSEEITARYIRREMNRDPWLVEVTKDLLGPERGGPSRVVVFKDFVAGDTAMASSIWMTAENLSAKPGEDLPPTLLDEIEWQFGFIIPRDLQVKTKVERGEASSPPDPPPEEKKDSTTLRNEELEKQYRLIEKAREVLKSRPKDSNRMGIIGVAEAWNLADSEVWRFVRAYR
ncbi:hypothetical protein Egran_02886 [Elaphomyces granulatus]|uniref:Uncharacterized protein n=1 Tax=Elaphomyces granulatus TaxID=519963 RepID=A0A232LZ96_9EURO|nr:hypothetical protein Egran_02886 [Elaphomyces granulatus]